MIIKGNWFLDSDGRRLMMRGVNLSGASKVPFEPDGATYRREHFFDHRNVSFVGRPFPLDEADEHFSRLKHCWTGWSASSPVLRMGYRPVGIATTCSSSSATGSMCWANSSI